jgi:cytoskeletal protein CcmA (bactofilin family)
MFGIGGKVETVIGEGAQFKGSFNVQGALYVNGRVEGDIESDEIVTLGEKAWVTGNISAPVVVVAGRLQGHVFGGLKVELLQTAKVGGDIRTPKVNIAQGALFEGNCEMLLPEVPEAALSKKK